MTDLRDHEIYARVSSTGRSVTVDPAASIEQKAAAIRNASQGSNTPEQESIEELLARVDEWAVCLDEWERGTTRQATIVPVADIRIEEHEVPQVTALNVRESQSLIGVDNYYAHTSNRYAGIIRTIDADELALTTDDVEEYSSNSATGLIRDQQIINQYYNEWDVYEHSNYQSEWVVARNENELGGQGEPYDYEVYIPVSDLDIDTDPSQDHQARSGIPLSLPSSARTSWDGPSQIGHFRMNATEILRADPDNVPVE